MVSPTPPPAREDSAQAQATIALQNTLTAAWVADPHLTVRDLTTATLRVEAPYAREVRLLVASIAGGHHVLAIGIPEAPGRYARGVDVTLYGFQPMIADAVADIDRIVAHARATAEQSTAAPGEELATHRGSVISGYRLGLTRPGLTPEQVAALVTTANPGGVRMRCTGSGTWTGYLAAAQTVPAAPIAA